MHSLHFSNCILHGTLYMPQLPAEPCCLMCILKLFIATTQAVLMVVFMIHTYRKALGLSTKHLRKLRYCPKLFNALHVIGSRHVNVHMFFTAKKAPLKAHINSHLVKNKGFCVRRTQQTRQLHTYHYSTTIGHWKSCFLRYKSI